MVLPFGQRQGNAPHQQRTWPVRLSQPTLLVAVGVTAGQTTFVHRSVAGRYEPRVGVVADEEMTAGPQHACGKHQVAVQPIQDHDPRPLATDRTADGGGDLEQQLLGQGAFPGLAIQMAHHGRRQAGPQVQRHRSAAAQNAGLQPPQRLQQALDMLDGFAIDREQLMLVPALGQPRPARCRRQHCVQACRAFLQERFADRQRQIAQLGENGSYGDRQRAIFLMPLKALPAAAPVLQQRLGDQVHQGRKLQHTFVATTAMLLPNLLQPRFGQRRLQQTPNRLCQGQLGQDSCREILVIHDSDNPREQCKGMSAAGLRNRQPSG
jgi:hypothetical protein